MDKESEEFKFRTIEDVNSHIRDIVDDAAYDDPFWTSGLISEYQISNLGHEYFRIESDGCSIHCMVSKKVRQNQKKLIAEGMEIEIFGRVAVYARTAQLQIKVEEINILKEEIYEPTVADLQQLKAKGIWTGKQQVLPQNLQKIALITSKYSKGKQDFIDDYRKSGGQAEIKFVHAVVQGKHAPKQIAQAIDRINSEAECDAIAIVRGGGDKAILRVFDDEMIVKAICRSKIPVITSIGHNEDHTLSDEVADYSENNPTAVATYLAKLSNELAESQTHLQLNWIIYAIGITIIVLLLFLIAQSL